jgi:hypothetical protein
MVDRLGYTHYGVLSGKGGKKNEVEIQVEAEVAGAGIIHNP